VAGHDRGGRVGRVGDETAVAQVGKQSVISSDSAHAEERFFEMESTRGQDVRIHRMGHLQPNPIHLVQLHLRSTKP
jgi:hypothetical protein